MNSPELSHSEMLAQHFANTPPAARCRNGHWCDIRAIKLPNRRLMWPVAEIVVLFDSKTQLEDKLCC